MTEPTSPLTAEEIRRLVVRAHRHLVMRGNPKVGEATYLKLMDDLLEAVESFPDTSNTLVMANDGEQVATLDAERAARLPDGLRLILADETLFDHWATRTEGGERITVEWGEPDEHGWYSPTFTVHADPPPS